MSIFVFPCACLGALKGFFASLTGADGALGALRSFRIPTPYRRKGERENLENEGRSGLKKLLDFCRERGEIGVCQPLLRYVTENVRGSGVPQPKAAQLPDTFRGRPHDYLEFLNFGRLPYIARSARPIPPLSSRIFACIILANLSALVMCMQGFILGFWAARVL